jgi:hypothetical protein
MVGTVVAQGKDEYSFMVQWDLNAAPSEEGYDELRISSLEDKDNIQEMQKKIDEATSSLEDAFDKVRELRNFAQDKFDGLYDLKYHESISMKELERVLDDGGWSSSSLYC